MKRFLFNHKLQAFIFITLGLIVVNSLLTYSSSDPSFNLVTQKHPDNLLGYFGCYLADLLYQLFGLGAFIFPLCFGCWAFILYRHSDLPWLPFKIITMILAATSTAILLSQINIPNLPAGGGGAIGVIIYNFLNNIEPLIILAVVFCSFFFLILSLGIKSQAYFKLLAKGRKILDKRFSLPLPKAIINILNHNPKPPIIKRAPVLSPAETNSRKEEVAVKVPTNYIKSTSYNHTNSPASSTLPPLDLLKHSENQAIQTETAAELKQTAENLLNVLADFGVKGQIIGISQGPVVTLYEFEPAAGTKSSRVIGLSDDIARSLSAVSTRIAVIPGKNVLGIELPNKQRAFFCLRELLETPAYQDQNMSLPLILGKDLAGKPYIADLAKMPHLLVAGTTGSGKSVAINTMIMSLLYRYTPQECRLIMIDPKMLELSIYDNIPHLLTPVVTEPSKAVVALKWAVKEMENRYRLMSNIGVRNISGYNAKIVEATSEGRTLERTVQTGFDPETGKPIYESIPINMEKLPFIVVIVDEMADLMIVAGKDIESSIQRLAQMARAAGIHIIMATQRPSVDVITGVIKANFPSRISFKVTSKIDSRTILGEQGAEQLLGMGDMLYMGNSSRISRVHGPFVNDLEVEKVTKYLRDTGVPEYISAVTEQEDEEDIGIEIYNDDNDEVAIYNRAVQIVKLERKVSISYIQRCLRIGYNKAANIIEQMEKDGIISPPSHSGKREILLPE